MRALVQRVSAAAVRVGDEEAARIGAGMVILLGVGREDREADADWIVAKLGKLRIFADAEGRISQPLGEREVLCVSQFTLYAELGSGNRPSFDGAAPAELARPLYERVCEGLDAERGVFGATMTVELAADGPVTVIVDSADAA